MRALAILIFMLLSIQAQAHDKPTINKPLMNQENLDHLLDKTLRFFKERDWEQFHSPKNLAMDLTAEVGELVEQFRFLTEEQSRQLDTKRRLAVTEEIGDVFRIIVYLSYKLGIDPVDAALTKLDKMEKKYPPELCHGQVAKYTDYEQAK